MFLLMVIEGPIVTMAAAFLASLGFFEISLVFLVSVCGDIVGDVVWYGIGRKWGLAFVRGPGRYLGMDERMIERVDRLFSKHGGKVIFGVKSTTGLCLVAFVAAGIARMDVKKFLMFSFLGGLVWSAILVFLGYFFGALYEQIAQYITWAGWFVGVSALLVFIAIGRHKKKRGDEYMNQ